jgi:hypothetical protein
MINENEVMMELSVGENQINSEKSLLQCHTIHHESHMKSPRVEPGHCGEKLAFNASAVARLPYIYIFFHTNS